MVRRPVLLGLAFALVMGVVSASIPSVRDAVANGVGWVAGPIERWGANVGARATSWWPGRAASRSRELELQLEAVTIESSRIATQLQEIRELAALSEALGARPLPTVAARVLLRNPDPAQQTLTLDRGSADGVTVGSAVLSGNAVLLGRIVSVAPRTAQVRLLTDPESRITVEIGSSVDAIGVVTGDRGTSASLGNLKRDVSLASGATVRTAGIDTGVPRGIPVGTVAEITTRPADLFQSATIILPGAERTPRTVLVVQGAQL